MKILIIGPSWVGDMVMSQCLYITIKQQHPEALIDVMAPGWCKPILERMPEVNKAIEMPLGHGQFNLGERYQLGKSLRTEGYDHAYILPNSAKSALIPWFAKIPQRTGWKGEMRYGLLNDLRSNKKSFQYMIERYITLAHSKKEMTGSGCLGDLESLPYPTLYIDKEQQTKALNKFKLELNRSVIGLCPGAEFGPAKRWPDQHYATIANEMINKGHQVWLFGSTKDREVTEKIKLAVDNGNQQHVFNLAGDTNLIEAVDLLAACHTVVSNDSGLMHVSAAVGCNIVAVYGSSSPKYTPPLSKNVSIVHTDIDCRPCFKRECPFEHTNCLVELQPGKVLEHLNRYLSENNN